MFDPFFISKFFAFLKGALSTGVKLKKQNEDALAKDLDEIILILSKVKKSIEERKIPRQQSFELAMLVNFADDKLKRLFPIPHLEGVFSQRLPRIGHLMRHADYFIDGEKREHLHEYMLRSKEEDLNIVADCNTIKEVCTEIDRALGELRGARRGLTGKSTRTVKNSN